MNTKEYIESGILELYVAGALSPSEAEEVYNYARTYPEIANEIEAIEKAFIMHASAGSKKPSEALLSKILATVDVPEMKSDDRKEEKIIQMKPVQRNSNFLKYMAYAAAILLFISGSLNVYYFSKYRSTRNELASLQKDKDYFAGEYTTIKTSYDAMAAEMNIIHSPANIAVTMKGSAIQPDALATIYWDRSNGNVYLNINNLPAPPKDHQYQLWALKDGKPIDAGVFDMKQQIQSMKNISAADAFAVTLEPAGGSVNPTLENLYVIGNV